MLIGDNDKIEAGLKYKRFGATNQYNCVELHVPNVTSLLIVQLQGIATLSMGEKNIGGIVPFSSGENR